MASSKHPNVVGPPHPAAPIPHPIVPPFHLPLPPGVELAEVFHVDGGAAPLCCLFPAQGLEGQSRGIITAPPPHSLSTRQPGESSYASPSYLTLIQGCTRHSDAVIRSLQERAVTVGVWGPPGMATGTPRDWDRGRDGTH